MMTQTLIFKNSSDVREIRFDKNLRHFEDHLFIIQLILKLKFCIVEEPLVARRVHENSTSFSFDCLKCEEDILYFSNQVKLIGLSVASFKL